VTKDPYRISRLHPLGRTRGGKVRLFVSPGLAMGLAAAIAALTFAAASAGAADWKGKKETREGVSYVVNPAEPMEKDAKAAAQELWRIGGDTEDENEFFGVITQLLTDAKGDVYLLDAQLNQVKIFSSEGKFIRSIGREGEGPGEFRAGVGMFFTNDGKIAVMQVAPGRIVLLTPAGEPAGEHPLPVREDGGMVILLGGSSRGGNLVFAGAANAFSEGRFDQTRYLARLSPDGKESAKYHAETRTIDYSKPLLDDMVWDTFDRRWVVGTDGRVYACTHYADYRIQVWNPDGTTNRVIERQYAHQKRTPEEKKIVEDLMGTFARQIPNATVKVSDFNKDVETIFVRDDGSIWVLTSEGTRGLPDGTAGVFDVLDPEGRFVRRVTIQAVGNPMTDAYYFVGNRLYVVTDLLQAAISLQSGGQSFKIGDEEPEPMSVVCYELGKEGQVSKK
jgi:sugar lactone lactonase YvrE